MEAAMLGTSTVREVSPPAVTAPVCENDTDINQLSVGKLENTALFFFKHNHHNQSHKTSLYSEELPFLCLLKDL